VFRLVVIAAVAAASITVAWGTGNDDRTAAAIDVTMPYIQLRACKKN
jgi:hypothetical protein